MPNLSPLAEAARALIALAEEVIELLGGLWPSYDEGTPTLPGSSTFPGSGTLPLGFPGSTFPSVATFPSSRFISRGVGLEPLAEGTQTLTVLTEN